MRMASHSSSRARSAAAESVLKYGLPVPAAQMTTRPFSRWRMARRRMYGSQTARISMALMTRVSTPSSSRASWRARAFCTVAIMPMWSPVARSMPPAAAAIPRKMLPPPTTMAMSTSRARAILMVPAIDFVVAGSIARVSLPSAWPLSLRRTRWKA